MSPPLKRPIVYLITEGEAAPENFPEKKKEILDIISTACRSGLGLVQIREKRLPGTLLFELVQAAVEIVSHSGTKVTVNDRADIAVAAGAHGVHLRADSLPVRVVKEHFPGLLTGVSVHSVDEARRARKEGADLAVLAPVYSTPGKGAPLGLGEFARACDELKPFPVIALGGVDETNYEEVLAAGGSGFAAIRFLNNRRNLENIARRFKS